MDFYGNDNEKGNENDNDNEKGNENGNDNDNENDNGGGAGSWGHYSSFMRR